MDTLQPRQRDEMLKNYLRTLPIWKGDFDSIRVEIDKLEYDLRRYLLRLDERVQQVAGLPKLNLENKIRVLPFNHAMNDLDIVKVYTRHMGGYKEKEKIRDTEHEGVGSEQDESLTMMHKKILVEEEVYAMLKPSKPWVKCRVKTVFRSRKGEARNKPVVTFRLKCPDSRIIDVSKFAIARIQHHGNRLRPTKRVIAGLTEDTLMPGIIANIPHTENKERYLVFMDDGSAKYYHQDQLYPILGQSARPWLDTRYLSNENTLNDAYLRHFFASYPRRHLILINEGVQLELIRNGNLVSGKVLEIDCDTVRIRYKDGIEETIYRGSPRLLKDEKVVSDSLANMRNINHFFKDIIWAMDDYYQVSQQVIGDLYCHFMQDYDRKAIVKLPTARKSTAERTTGPPKVKVKVDSVVFQDDVSQMDYTECTIETNMAHKCTPDCLNVPGVRTEIYVDDIIDEYRNVSDLRVPMILGWKRRLQKVSGKSLKNNSQMRILIIYQAPCGKMFKNPFDIRRHLTQVHSKMDVDYFSFERELDLGRRLDDLDAYFYVENLAVDSRTGIPLENKFITVINQYSEERLAEDFEYCNKSFPHPMLAAKGFSFNTDFKSSCDCSDDCFQRVTCPCHKLNEEFSGSYSFNRGAIDKNCQYSNKRLIAQVPTGVFECNSKCSCSTKCNNKVVQNGIRFRLRVQKTLSKGWGVVTLDDIPRGAFICTYAAEILDDADQYGNSDMYYADLDYITVNEQSKEMSSDNENPDEGVELSEEECEPERHPPNINLSDFYMPKKNDASQSRYPKRKINQKPEAAKPREKEKRVKFKKIHDILESHDYTLDARIQGNVGRFFNHSCDPSAFVQSVFIETHDLRFPEIAFFAGRNIKALEEITWNYNYKMGSIEGRHIDCYCGAPNCRGRIL